MTTDTLDPTRTDAAVPALELRIAEACAALHPTAEPPLLVAAVQDLMPDTEVRLVLSRGGWHRPGGVVTAEGQRVALAIQEWAERESGGDVDELVFKVADLGLRATRLDGRTHYLVAPTGPGARDFLQIEVEELTEVLDRELIQPDWFPDSIAELVDPLDFPHLEPTPVDAPRLVFRRLLRVADWASHGDPGPRLRRFLDDWDRSSPAETEAFCHHWVLGVREYLDRDGDGHLAAKPIAVAGEAPPVRIEGEIPRGSTLANLIHGFDRELGYPFAWYFHMLTSTQVSHRLAEAVHADQMGAYDYLPARDLKVLRDWYDAPYGL
ncbi:MAG: hypothetical protein EOM21_17905 [Gammaproteobacteria bacterium]|nr:hypothetical protein [Gammaproteobacteria bacterium]